MWRTGCVISAPNAGKKSSTTARSRSGVRSAGRSSSSLNLKQNVSRKKLAEVIGIIEESFDSHLVWTFRSAGEIRGKDEPPEWHARTMLEYLKAMRILLELSEEA